MDYFEDVDSYNSDTPEDKRSLEAVALEKPIRSLSLRKPLCVEESRPVGEAIQVMRENRMGSVLVTRKGRLVGIFTERDVLNHVALGKPEFTASRLGDCMRADPETLPPHAPMAYALNLMSVGGFRHIPLVDESGKAVGIVSVRDIVTYLVDHFPDKVLNLPPVKKDNFPGSREGA